MELTGSSTICDGGAPPGRGRRPGRRGGRLNSHQRRKKAARVAEANVREVLSLLEIARQHQRTLKSNSQEEAFALYETALRLLAGVEPPVDVAVVRAPPSSSFAFHPFVECLVSGGESQAQLVYCLVRSEQFEQALGHSTFADRLLRRARTLVDGAFAHQLQRGDEEGGAGPLLAILTHSIDLVSDSLTRSAQHLRAAKARIERKLQPLAESREQARARMGEERWKANKPMEARSSWAEQRHKLLQQLMHIEQLEKEIQSIVEVTQTESSSEAAAMPLPDSRKAVAEQFLPVHARGGRRGRGGGRGSSSSLCRSTN